MQLEIRPAREGDRAITGRFRLERGEMTIGRDPSCTVVVKDSSRTVSKIHCRILRDGVGFLLRDESVNGVSLGGRELAEGESVRLVNGDEIRFCGHRLAVRISGDEEPDWSDPDGRLSLSDEAPSITAILADVAPGGRGASSMLPGHLGEDWMRGDPIGRSDPLCGSGAVPGWAGPPSSSLLGAAIPDDWNLGSDGGSRNEHVAATGIRVAVMKRQGEPVEPPKTPSGQQIAPAQQLPPALPQVVSAQAQRAPAGQQAAVAQSQAAPAGQAAAVASGGESGEEALLNAFLQGYGAPLEAVGDRRLFIHRMGHCLRQLVEHSNRISGQTRAFASDEGVALEHCPIDPGDPRSAIEALERNHHRLMEAVSWLLGETDRLAPTAIATQAQEASATLSDRFRESMMPGRDAGRAWRSYYSAYYIDGATPRARFAFHLGGGSDPTAQADSFEELNADTTPHGAAR